MEKATNVPRLIRPSSASQPPKASTATWPSAGTAASAEPYRAWMRSARSREANRSSADSASRSSSRSSCPKPLTTRTPETASSTTPATSAARCWASHAAGNTVSRSRMAIQRIAGTTTRLTTVSSGDSTAMTPRDSTTMTRLPLASGRKASMLWTRPTSEPARETSWPVWKSSWRAKSRRCRRS